MHPALFANVMKLGLDDILAIEVKSLFFSRKNQDVILHRYVPILKMVGSWRVFGYFIVTVS